MGEAALVVGDADDGLRERLDAEINAFNAAATGIGGGRLLCVSVRVDGGDLRGGLFGGTWGGCGYVEFLWVRHDQRGSGLGTRLLAAAEQEIRRRGCAQGALSTHSFQAPGFYARFGYRECGRTPAYPRGYDQIHLVKRLGESGRPGGYPRRPFPAPRRCVTNGSWRASSAVSRPRRRPRPGLQP